MKTNRINSNSFFNDLNFEECEFAYGTGIQKCYRGPDGGFYRVDYFGDSYVIEFAEKEEAAKRNQFEDTDLYVDDGPIGEIIKKIKDDIKRFSEEA